MLWVLKRTVSSGRSCDGSFEHPKQRFKLMDKEFFTILHLKLLCISTYEFALNKKQGCESYILPYLSYDCNRVAKLNARSQRGGGQGPVPLPWKITIT